MRSCCIAQGTIIYLRWNMMEDNVRKRMCIYTLTLTLSLHIYIYAYIYIYIHFRCATTGTPLIHFFNFKRKTTVAMQKKKNEFTETMRSFH